MIDITAKTNNSVSPVIITLGDGSQFEISGELMENGFSAYKATLKKLKSDGTIIELHKEEIDKFSKIILQEVEKAHFSMRFLLY